MNISSSVASISRPIITTDGSSSLVASVQDLRETGQPDCVIREYLAELLSQGVALPPDVKSQWSGHED
jgi:hypothetical protein